ncbi:Hot1p SCDLUD_001132 [Saccharomycodes ludwigii]|uniref:Hot1p n=1 Tax=Saccharomycodes ludwigii TaxID=36035 RepID=UPI001E88BF5C|nr:hypothetical protein SCDLUD_001132 [Saccharomycodes ludwigii]KAH3903492.1 hypothetical protein SCDLUD_001132 [Saccharomycodes ludwigii]
MNSGNENNNVADITAQKPQKHISSSATAATVSMITNTNNNAINNTHSSTEHTTPDAQYLLGYPSSARQKHLISEEQQVPLSTAANSNGTTATGFITHDLLNDTPITTATSNVVVGTIETRTRADSKLEPVLGPTSITPNNNNIMLNNITAATADNHSTSKIVDASTNGNGILHSDVINKTNNTTTSSTRNIGPAGKTTLIATQPKSITNNTQELGFLLSESNFNSTKISNLISENSVNNPTNTNAANSIITSNNINHNKGNNNSNNDNNNNNNANNNNNNNNNSNNNGEISSSSSKNNNNNNNTNDDNTNINTNINTKMNNHSTNNTNIHANANNNNVPIKNSTNDDDNHNTNININSISKGLAPVVTNSGNLTDLGSVHLPFNNEVINTTTTTTTNTNNNNNHNNNIRAMHDNRRSSRSTASINNTDNTTTTHINKNTNYLNTSNGTRSINNLPSKTANNIIGNNENGIMVNNNGITTSVQLYQRIEDVSVRLMALEEITRKLYFKVDEQRREILGLRAENKALITELSSNLVNVNNKLESFMIDFSNNISGTQNNHITNGNNNSFGLTGNLFSILSHNNQSNGNVNITPGSASNPLEDKLSLLGDVLKNRMNSSGNHSGTPATTLYTSALLNNYNTTQNNKSYTDGINATTSSLASTKNSGTEDTNKNSASTYITSNGGVLNDFEKLINEGTVRPFKLNPSVLTKKKKEKEQLRKIRNRFNSDASLEEDLSSLKYEKGDRNNRDENGNHKHALATSSSLPNINNFTFNSLLQSNQNVSTTLLNGGNNTVGDNTETVQTPKLLNFLKLNGNGGSTTNLATASNHMLQGHNRLHNNNNNNNNNNTAGLLNTAVFTLDDNSNNSVNTEPVSTISNNNNISSTATVNNMAAPASTVNNPSAMNQLNSDKKVYEEKIVQHSDYNNHDNNNTEDINNYEEDDGYEEEDVDDEDDDENEGLANVKRKINSSDSTKSFTKHRRKKRVKDTGNVYATNDGTNKKTKTMKDFSIKDLQNTKENQQLPKDIDYLMVKAPETVRLIWEEYIQGVDGKPSVMYLENTYGNRWRREKNSKTFSRRKRFYKFIINGMKEGKTADEMINILESKREYIDDKGDKKKKTIGWLQQTLAGT